MVIKTGTIVEHAFEIVNKIPPGYFVWNIGENMGTCDYIPICEKLYPWAKASDVFAYQINPDTLKAVPLNRNDVLILRESASWGINSVKTAKSSLKRKYKTEAGQKKHRLAALALEILTPITE